jgi:hypothetical protein
MHSATTREADVVARSADRRTRLLGSLLLLLALGLLPGVVRAAHEPIEQLVLPDYQENATTDGDWLAWSSGDGGWSGEERISVMRLGAAEISDIASGPGLRYIAGLSDGILLVANCDDPEWPDGDGPMYCPHPLDLYGVELATDRRFAIGQTDAGASIAGDTVVWRTGRWEGPYTFYARNIRTMAPAEEIITRDVDTLNGYALTGDQLLWQEGDQRLRDDDHWRFMTLPLDSDDAEPRVLLERYAIVRTVADGQLATSGADGFAVLDIVTGAERSFPNPDGPFGTSDLVIDGRYLFWTRAVDTGDVHVYRVDIWGYDLQTSTLFPAIIDAGLNIQIRAQAGLLLWAHGSESPQHSYATLRDIAIAPIATLLPDRSHTDPDALAFAETGQVLQGRFRDLWEASEGLTPYELQLGHLGWEEVDRRLISYYDAFQPLPTFDHPIKPECRYFAETQHQICGDFLTFWESHGLEFGDPGVSYRESLALFGYPISETFTDVYLDEVNTAQYFERVRLEWHPGNPDPHKVQISRFGAIMEHWRGW